MSKLCEREGQHVRCAAENPPSGLAASCSESLGGSESAGFASAVASLLDSTTGTTVLLPDLAPSSTVAVLLLLSASAFCDCGAGATGVLPSSAMVVVCAERGGGDVVCGASGKQSWEMRRFDVDARVNRVDRASKEASRWMGQGIGCWMMK